MTLSEELTWRGFVNQTTYKKLTELDGEPIRFYWGVDPSADSMTIGNLAAAMMVKCFMKHGHKPYLLVGGATGLIGDPDGKRDERQLLTAEDLEHNKQAIVAQYKQLFGSDALHIVDNYDWFKDMNYLQFLREVGKRVPMRQMLQREFVQSRLSEDGSGISYAEFSYVLIQAYDFLTLYNDHQVTLQVCGSDQWGNSIAGVDLIRRVTGNEANVYSVPLIVNKTTGVKFGKSEAGAIWLDPQKTTPTEFYQFWMTVDDTSVADYLRVFTELSQPEIEQIEADHQANPKLRSGQARLAAAVTTLVHGVTLAEQAATVTDFLTGRSPIAEADDANMDMIRQEIPVITAHETASVIEALVRAKLADSNGDARRLLASGAIAINGQKIDRENFVADDFHSRRLLLRRGKAFKDSAVVEII